LTVSAADPIAGHIINCDYYIFNRSKMACKLIGDIPRNVS
jgi:hypothetical protein